MRRRRTARQNLQLVTLDSGGAGEVVEVGTCPPLPITFEPPVEDDGAPVIAIATATPVRFIRRGDDFEATYGIEAIGDSTNPVRQIVFAGDRAMTQHWDRGLLYRAAPGDQLNQPIKVTGTQRQVADGRDVPAGAIYFVDADEDNGGGYLIADGSGDRLLLPLTPDGTASGVTRSGSFFKKGTETGTIAENGGLITLTDQSGHVSTAQHAVDLFLSIAGQPLGIWHLRYDDDDAAWKLPADSPDLPAHTGLAYQLLDLIADADLKLQDYFQLQPSDALDLSQLLTTVSLRSFYSDFAVTRVEYFGNFPAIRLDHALIDDETAVLTVAAGGWTALGPSDPANPALSWEYWNGASWWALDTDAFDFSDRTANLQISQGIFFKAPANLTETEVGGRKNLWIRARLVGGDYGEAKVTVTSEVKGTKTEQSVTRDLSAIRAPYIISLKINYCVTEPVKPAIVVTADNLGMIDQTNANDAGLPVTIFPTVAEALAPQAAAAPDFNSIPDCCREMPDTDTIAPGTGPEPASAASRAVLIGFDQPIDQSPLSLFVDAVAHGGDWAIEAAMFRAGGFWTARVLSDGSSGLGESGVIAIEVAQPPDRIVLFGTSAYWLRLTPKGDATAWSPRLRGVYLNGVVAASVETRTIETIGTSSGAPDQQFRLFATPIDPDSLILRVAEPVGEDEALALGAASDVAGMPGPWVAWTRVDEFPVEGSTAPARLFTTDAERGIVGFGNGRNALVPPMGSAVLALAYQRVAGASANAVSAGDKLQLVSPIAGIDRVTALDGAAGVPMSKPLKERGPVHRPSLPMTAAS
ncbi:hypothetical protein [Sphingomonas sp. 7/4-4]|uniref:hypothetical protein n=1 Tax=Sphingomonas sp. 7/4-4 TaxID=3018446 RepID=UPI00300E0543